MVGGATSLRPAVGAYARLVIEGLAHDRGALESQQRSSRAIKRHCRQDVAWRVITGNLIPDHATIARFICRHERALGELFGEVLRLCDRAGLVRPGVVSIDGTISDGSYAARPLPSARYAA